MSVSSVRRARIWPPSRQRERKNWNTEVWTILNTQTPFKLPSNSLQTPFKLPSNSLPWSYLMHAINSYALSMIHHCITTTTSNFLSSEQSQCARRSRAHCDCSSTSHSTQITPSLNIAWLEAEETLNTSSAWRTCTPTSTNFVETSERNAMRREKKQNHCKWNSGVEKSKSKKITKQ